MPPFKITGTYRYFDENGKLLYWKERLEPGRFGKSKEFRFLHGEREKGRGCDPVLYRLPQVLAAKAVIINEGEKQADLLAGWGLVATSLDSGSNSKITPAMVASLAGKRIAILKDNDAPGEVYAGSIAKALNGVCESIKIVSLPGLPAKGDICDWVEIEVNDKARLLSIIKSTPEWVAPAEEPKKERKKVKIVTGKITDEMIAQARQYPIDQIITFNHGQTSCISPEHEDKKPSMYHGTKTNKAICGACGVRFDAIEAYQIINEVSFLDAVRQLCS